MKITLKRIKENGYEIILTPQPTDIKTRNKWIKALRFLGVNCRKTGEYTGVSRETVSKVDNDMFKYERKPIDLAKRKEELRKYKRNWMREYRRKKKAVDK